MVEAIAMAHGWEMQHDPSVVVIGQDVGANGGVFRATAGLQARFGTDRVQDTPLAEATIAGMSVGMATHGLKPVAEIQFMGFMYPALDQIVNHMSRMRYRTRGRLTCPVVIRTPHGGGIHAPEHHSESTETMLCHIPGIRVVCPSSPARAYGLLLAAIRDPDPVMFLEPVRLYRAMRQEVSDDGQALPLDHCFILREGSDVTIVTWGAMTIETLRAVGELESQGISAEIIDLATLSPIDGETILASVAKTGRLVIVHEAARNVGVGAEIAALVAEHGLYDLHAPVQRVDRLRHHHAAVPARARLHSVRATHRGRSATHLDRLETRAWVHSSFRIWARVWPRPKSSNGTSSRAIVFWWISRWYRWKRPKRWSRFRCPTAARSRRCTAPSATSWRPARRSSISIPAPWSAACPPPARKNTSTRRKSVGHAAALPPATARCRWRVRWLAALGSILPTFPAAEPAD